MAAKPKLPKPSAAPFVPDRPTVKKLLIALGATAAQALMGRAFRVTQQRGQIMEAAGTAFLATVHPSSVLRAPDRETRESERARFIKDLQTAAEFLGEHGKN